MGWEVRSTLRRAECKCERPTLSTHRSHPNQLIADHLVPLERGEFPASYRSSRLLLERAVTHAFWFVKKKHKTCDDRTNDCYCRGAEKVSFSTKCAEFRLPFVDHCTCLVIKSRTPIAADAKISHKLFDPWTGMRMHAARGGNNAESSCLRGAGNRGCCSEAS